MSKDNKDDKKLTEIFSKVGEKYGAKNVKAKYMAFDDVKARWTKSSDKLELQISDYLSDAPEKVLKSFADMMLKKLYTDETVEYPKELRTWVTDPEFSKVKAPIFMNRHDEFVNTHQGHYINLMSIYDSLIKNGLIDAIPNLKITWEETGSRKLGHCSVLMRIVSVSTKLDAEDTPDFVIEYCLYHELLHLQVGYNPDNMEHNVEVTKLDDKYPRKKDALDWMRKNDVFI